MPSRSAKPPTPTPPTPKPSANGQPAHRRGEAKKAILSTARAEFGTKGFAGTTMRDIAQRAEVSEALLYRYFPAKDTLFERAVIEPYHRFVESYLDNWAAIASADRLLSNEEMVSRFVTTLYDFILENRDLVFALVAADRFGERDMVHVDGAEGTGSLGEEVRRLAEFTGREAHDRGLGGVDLEMAVSCTVAMVFSMALLDNLLFGKGAGRPGRERLVEQMCRYATAGIQQRR